MIPVVAAVILLALTPGDLLAWTPGTHILIGEAVLRNAALLPPAVAALLRAHPADFLYGSIAADTAMAKKYAAFGRHCHAWHVGFEILHQARTPALQAFGYGYLAHLAADVVAHNHYVPLQLALTSSTSGVGHSYWESRFEQKLGEPWPARAREIIQLDHRLADRHLDRILSPTIFSTPTNRQLFRGMVYVTDAGAWQRIMTLMDANSRWELPGDRVTAHLHRSFDYVMDFLVRGEGSEPFALDPAGDEALRGAKPLRRAALRRGGEPAVLEAAETRYGLPAAQLTYAASLGPLYPPARSPSS